MVTTNDLNIKNNGIPIFNASTGAFSETIPPADQALVGGANGVILGVDPTGHDVGNPLCSTGVGTPPDYSATPTVDDITIINLPVDPTDGANKQYVDLIGSGFTFLDATLCATTANLTANYANGVAGVGATLTNAGILQAFSIDNYSPLITERVLIKNQTNAVQNGVYQLTTVGDALTPWVLTRAPEYDEASEILPGTLASVLYGDTNGDTIWSQTQNVTTVGTDPILFIQFNQGGTGYLLAANNLSDVQDVATSRNNLGLTNVATQNVTQYSVLLGGAADSIVSLATGAYGQVLTSGGPGVNPSWAAAAGGAGFSSINVQIFSTPGTFTYTPTPNMQYCIVELIGGGGGGGLFGSKGQSVTIYANTAPNNTYVFFGCAGGGSGAYCRSLYSAATIGASQTGTIGAGGTGIANSFIGNPGQASTFGSTISPVMSAGGGSAGSGLADANLVAGVASGGNILNLSGNYPNGSNCVYYYNRSGSAYTTYFTPNAGIGASSFYGNAPSNYGVYTSGEINGPNATEYGAGGNAGFTISNSNGIGGTGASGVCIITEFISG